ncbi:maltokinase N-terminal cap-like domain-containing protein [Streptomyces sp. DSM 15324]|uniref:maltokinase N-terminal cap-like domain-containing protein n=1 Tax=Streptomyces sp. DSM 15324 TaxID=1739111 RepID=UPI00074919CB|nr:1,4-alpha-glucan branching protein [Streptomyces sp. DSM 15324]KUO09748.1 1,4-alpha-glucan branching protein [Streptomyces sp. DSM 15324]
MAVIHRTVLTPTKLELLTDWLPSRPWYRGGAGAPRLAKAGGFRLDDPQGEVGIEFMVVTDTSAAPPLTYLLPLTYRGAPLDGADHALVGTMEHGVLGRRWAYDGCHDPVLLAQSAALIEGRAQAQQQSVSDTVDREVVATRTGGAALPTVFTATDDREGTEAVSPHGVNLRFHRVLGPGPSAPSDLPRDAVGQVTACWQAPGTPDGTRTRGVFVSAVHAPVRPLADPATGADATGR